MPRRAAYPLLSVPLDTQRAMPLHRQVYLGVRQAILEGRALPGAALPSTRALAAELHLSRNTVLLAFEQLAAEGYVEGQGRSATRVARHLPGAPPPAAELPASTAAVQTSRRHQRAQWPPDPTLGPMAAPHGWAFAVGMPALDAFPRETWARLVARRARHQSPLQLGVQSAAGYGPLRQAVAQYLGQARGIRCEASQVIITHGTQHALSLAAHVLADPGDGVWLEDPGYIGAHLAFRHADLHVCPVAVDEQGLQVDWAQQHHPQARLAYVTPSHQFPLGHAMSLPRRLELLHWAATQRTWVLEDDYDSEYRFQGRPLAALTSLDMHGRVLYLGTFSKLLHPTLRLAYLVVPPNLIDAFASTIHQTLTNIHPLEQHALTDFIEEGHFARHIRAMRVLYAERQQQFLQLAAQELPAWARPQPSHGGLHLTVPLPDRRFEHRAAQQLRAAGLLHETRATFSLRPSDEGALFLGYAAVRPGDMAVGMRVLGQALRTVRRER